MFRASQVETYSPGKRLGLQFADAVASSYYFAVEQGPFGFTEDAYARQLLPRAYRQNGELWNYGIKITPEPDERLAWAG